MKNYDFCCNISSHKYRFPCGCEFSIQVLDACSFPDEAFPYYVRFCGNQHLCDKHSALSLNEIFKVICNLEDSYSDGSLSRVNVIDSDYELDDLRYDNPLPHVKLVDLDIDFRHLFESFIKQTVDIRVCR